MSLGEVVKQSSVFLPFQETAIGSMRLGLRLDPIRHRIYGYEERMCVIENERAYAPLESGWKPGQIYEICLFEGAHKDQLIQNLRHTHKRHLYISDQLQEFRDLKSLHKFLNTADSMTELLIIDISELLYLDFIKDAERLKANIRTFYERLERLSKKGLTCVVFVNYLYYCQIFRGTVRPDSVQTLIYPSPISLFWDAEAPELNYWRSLFSPWNSDLPYLQ